MTTEEIARRLGEMLKMSRDDLIASGMSPESADRFIQETKDIERWSSRFKLTALAIQAALIPLWVGIGWVLGWAITRLIELAFKI